MIFVGVFFCLATPRHAMPCPASLSDFLNSFSVNKLFPHQKRIWVPPLVLPDRWCPQRLNHNIILLPRSLNPVSICLFRRRADCTWRKTSIPGTCQGNGLHYFPPVIPPTPQHTYTHAPASHSEQAVIHLFLWSFALADIVLVWQNHYRTKNFLLLQRKEKEQCGWVVNLQSWTWFFLWSCWLLGESDPPPSGWGKKMIWSFNHPPV